MLRLTRSWTSIIARRSISSSTSASHPFTPSPSLLAKPLPPRLEINDADVTISYLKGTGPGGQKINKTNSAVQIIHHPTGIVVKCQATRSRSQNQKIARQLLADKVEQQKKGDGSRAALKNERARKKKASKMKKTRRKYRGLGIEGEEPEIEVEVEGDGGTEGGKGKDGAEEMQKKDDDGRENGDGPDHTKKPPKA